MKFRYEHMTLTQIGQIFGTSSHEIGKWLTEIGLRYESNFGKKPSRRAFTEGYVVSVSSRGEGYLWAWHAQKTVAALQDAGHQVKIQPGHELLAPCFLNGPFECRPSPSIGFEIVNGDGSVAVNAVGEKNALFVTRLLNLADQSGFLAKHLRSGTDDREMVV